ncbi:helix-turn-helix transcriptional regulator [Mesorhizobium sp. M7A.F.Ca.CA.001.09.2.1]|uniref:response regulator transcription factor n=2 Tax=Phyllobacteriaceae TaxID=69277 RepID=UPI0003FDFF4A|nr:MULTISPECIES: LuxR C-terminal-related transcriptional regulator [Mesorhizobium]RVA56977.1 helix-turn-helix transcriptional regulator [Mesorhizobium sp. M7A.F.Ca.US.001.01.1.1]AMX95686.1 helix-turn-helix transcriptional regulator [Mesorhizobium ciceri]AMY02925.1 helix-turn-helix transcriptional regulator [Mesorhizobium ciceri biovar biserrulae]ARP62910.1 helix-turn-helix transcriptional regulator [Mesorhizobium sp. WSM1497]MBZ9717185.1 LuxR C-terminal-related transcriptional regulator [Mesor
MSRSDEYSRLATLVATTRETSGDLFGQALVEWLRQHVRFDHCVIFGYRGASRPPLLFETFSPTESHVFVALYQEGPYLLDPFHHAAVERKEGFWRMRELAPDRFYASEYFRSYYSQTRLAEEVGFFVPLPGKDALVLSLMRLRASGPFGTADARLLRDMAPAVISFIRLRWPALPADETAEAKQDETAAMVNEFDRAHIWQSLSLTPREKHVVDLVLQGHSTESIARAMRIVPGTVKVHRRNIYRKLKIKSQAGLFARFVEIIDARIR